MAQSEEQKAFWDFLNSGSFVKKSKEARKESKKIKEDPSLSQEEKQERLEGQYKQMGLDPGLAKLFKDPFEKVELVLIVAQMTCRNCGSVHEVPCSDPMIRVRHVSTGAIVDREIRISDRTEGLAMTLKYRQHDRKYCQDCFPHMQPEEIK